MTVQFGLPDSSQCTQWWAEHAKQLSPFRARALGFFSSGARLSFRELWAAANCMVIHDAAKEEGGAPAGTLGLSEYVREVRSETRRNFLWPAAVGATFQKARNGLFAINSVLFLRGRIAEFREPRASTTQHMKTELFGIC